MKFSLNLSRTTATLRKTKRTILIAACSALSLVTYAQDECFKIVFNNSRTITAPVTAEADAWNGSFTTQDATISGGTVTYFGRTTYPQTGSQTNGDIKVDSKGFNMNNNATYLKIKLDSPAKLVKGTKIKVTFTANSSAGQVLIVGTAMNSSIPPVPSDDPTNIYVQIPSNQSGKEVEITEDIELSEFIVRRGGGTGVQITGLTITDCGGIDQKIIALVPRLTYMYDAKRRENVRSYTSKRHRMPLAKVISTENPGYTTQVKLIRKGTTEETNFANDQQGRNFNNFKSWIVPYNRTESGYTILADFEKLRRTLVDTLDYRILPDTTAGQNCNTYRHLHPGDIIKLYITLDGGMTVNIPIEITDKYHIGYIVRGNVFGNFYEVCKEGELINGTNNRFDKTNYPDLYDGVYDMLENSGKYHITAVNAWAEFDTLNYKPFDILFLTDYPTVGSNIETREAAMNNPDPSKNHPYFINQMHALVGMRPIFTWKGFLASAALPNWTDLGLTGSPYQTNWSFFCNNDGTDTGLQAVKDSLLTMTVVCDHAVFRNLEIGEEGKDEDGIYRLKILDDLSEPTDNNKPQKSRVGLQGFDDLAPGFVAIAYLDVPKSHDSYNGQDDNGTPPWNKYGKPTRLYTCIEWQEETNARFMIFSVYKNACEKLNDNGKAVIISSLDYLLDANPAHVEDCAYVFDNGYDYYYVDASEADRDLLEEEFGAEHVFNIYEKGELAQYRVRYSRDDYDTNFTNDSTLFKESNPDLPYPFTPHDNKWRNKANWLQYNFPTAAHNVRLRSTAHLDSATYEVIDLRINDRVAKLHIEPTGGLKTSGKFEHYDGAKSYHKRFSIDTDTLLYIHSDSEHTGMLAHRHGKDTINRKINTPLYATVSLYSAAHYDYEDETKDPVTAYKWWTYFGMPVMNGTIPYIFYMAYTYKWVEKDNNWTRMGDKTVLTTWDGYALSQEKPETFRLPGQLQYVNDTTLYLSYTPWNEEEKTGGEGANIIGYSWTAPLHIDSIRFPQDNETYDAEKHDLYNVEPKIYIYNTGRDPGWYTKTKGENGEDIEQNTHTRPEHGNEGAGDAAFGNWEAGHWYAIPIGPTRLGSWPDDLKVVPTMNAFMVMAKSSDNTAYAAKDKKASIRLDYNRMVYNPIVVNHDWNSNSDDGVEINNTPRKVRRAEDDQPLLMRIIVSDGQTISNVFLIQDDSFTEGYDSGWESEYTGGANGLWVYSSFGDLFTAAFPTLDGRVLGFKAAKEDEYQFSFGDWEGERLYLNDSKLRRSTIIAKSQTYSFMASKDDEPNRFFISSVPYDIQTPTGIEDLVVVDGELQVNNPTGERLTVTVYDAAGRMFSRTVTNDALTQVSIPQGATGVYLVSVEGSQTSFVRKVVR